VKAPALVPPVLPNNGEKGVYGEHLSDADMRAQDHTKLNDGGLLTPPPPGGSARGHGIDGVWRHGNPPRPTTSSPRPSTTPAAWV
jgi:hypothetical protein